MNVLFDASAVFKRYSGEVGVQRVVQLHQQSSQVVAAAHCRTEVASALTRQWRDGLFSEEEYSRVLAEIAVDFEACNVVAISPLVERHALTAMRLAPLRGMDALHIGTAQAAAVDLFVTADRRQAFAARACGLTTELIEA